MITRDPLHVPCLIGKYWETFVDVPGVALARTLTTVRAHKPPTPLPRISGLSEHERYALELEHVERSIAHAREHLGL